MILNWQYEVLFCLQFFGWDRGRKRDDHPPALKQNRTEKGTWPAAHWSSTSIWWSDLLISSFMISAAAAASACSTASTVMVNLVVDPSWDYFLAASAGACKSYSSWSARCSSMPKDAILQVQQSWSCRSHQSISCWMQQQQNGNWEAACKNRFASCSAMSTRGFLQLGHSHSMRWRVLLQGPAIHLLPMSKGCWAIPMPISRCMIGCVTSPTTWCTHH